MATAPSNKINLHDSWTPPCTSWPAVYEAGKGHTAYMAGDHQHYSSQSLKDIANDSTAIADFKTTGNAKKRETQLSKAKRGSKEATVRLQNY